MRVLVTGAAGRVGTGVRQELSGRHNVRAFDLVPCDADEVVVGDLLDPEARHRAVEGVDAIAHLAFCRQTDDVAGSYAVNARGSYELLAEARECGVRRFVYASTLSVYGGQQWHEHARRGTMSEDVAPEPDSVYGLTKYMGEEACRLFARQGMQTIILRLTGVTTPEAWEGVAQHRWGGSTHVADVAQAFRLALECEIDGVAAPTYHICGDHPNKPTPIGRAWQALGFRPVYNIA